MYYHNSTALYLVVEVEEWRVVSQHETDHTSLKAPLQCGTVPYPLPHQAVQKEQEEDNKMKGRGECTHVVLTTFFCTVFKF